MLVLIVVLLALLPAAAILYPFLKKGAGAYYEDEDETSTAAELSRRWDSAIAGLRNTELEHAIGSLDEQSYALLREQYMTEAALIMKTMDLEEEQEQALRDQMDTQARDVRRRILGHESPPGEADRCG